jgi:hypothetical protein
VSRVVTAHVYGWQLALGPIDARPGEDPVIWHRCDQSIALAIFGRFLSLPGRPAGIGTSDISCAVGSKWLLAP